jgi:ribosome-associated protein
MTEPIQSGHDGSTLLTVTSSVRIPLSALRFRTSRSSGPGGQNVNKLETRVELLFDVLHSLSLTDDQRHRVMAALGSRVDGEGVLHISSQRSRSQWENKQGTIEKLILLLRDALKIRKKRVKTAPTRGANEQRVRLKKKHGQKKKLRKVHPGDE